MIISKFYVKCQCCRPFKSLLKFKLPTLPT